MLGRLEQVSREIGLPFETVDLDRLGTEADVIISITSSFSPILKASQVRPGTHLACMGTDTKGKQEVETALVARASRFADEIAQSTTIGECQHAIADGAITAQSITELGAVVSGGHPGRQYQEEITLFDGTGVGLQDLAVAAAAVRRAVGKGCAIDVDF
jgi:ornithine cyclodeaminase/alanine dehydrogenase-like protein (mu-crystallin family)